MKKAKYFTALALFVLILSSGNPPVTGASADGGLPPAIVLVQDKDNKMLVNHNFVYDTKLFVPGDTNTDPGFYANIPEKKQ